MSRLRRTFTEKQQHTRPHHDHGMIWCGFLLQKERLPRWTASRTVLRGLPTRAALVMKDEHRRLNDYGPITQTSQGVKDATTLKPTTLDRVDPIKDSVLFEVHARLHMPPAQPRPLDAPSLPLRNELTKIPMRSQFIDHDAPFLQHQWPANAFGSTIGSLTRQPRLALLKACATMLLLCQIRNISSKSTAAR